MFVTFSIRILCVYTFQAENENVFVTFQYTFYAFTHFKQRVKKCLSHSNMHFMRLHILSIEWKKWSKVFVTFQYTFYAFTHFNQRVKMCLSHSNTHFMCLHILSKDWKMCLSHSNTHFMHLHILSIEWKKCLSHSNTLFRCIHIRFWQMRQNSVTFVFSVYI